MSLFKGVANMTSSQSKLKDSQGATGAQSIKSMLSKNSTTKAAGGEESNKSFASSAARPQKRVRQLR
jgi:hypothetical protein